MNTHEKRLVLTHDVSILTCMSLHHLKSDLEATLKEVQLEAAAATIKNRQQEFSKQTVSQSVVNDLRLALEHLARVQVKIYCDAAHVYDGETDEWSETEEKEEESNARNVSGMPIDAHTQLYEHNLQSKQKTTYTIGVKDDIDLNLHNQAEQLNSTRQEHNDVYDNVKNGCQVLNGNERNSIMAPESRNLNVAVALMWWTDAACNYAIQQLYNLFAFHNS